MTKSLLLGSIWKKGNTEGTCCATPTTVSASRFAVPGEDDSFVEGAPSREYIAGHAGIYIASDANYNNYFGLSDQMIDLWSADPNNGSLWSNFYMADGHVNFDRSVGGEIFIFESAQDNTCERILALDSNDKLRVVTKSSIGGGSGGSTGGGGGATMMTNGNTREYGGDGNFMVSPTYTMPIPMISSLKFELYLVFNGASTDHRFETQLVFTEAGAGDATAAVYGSVMFDLYSDNGTRLVSKAVGNGNPLNTAIDWSALPEYENYNGFFMKVTGTLVNASQVLDKQVAFSFRTYYGYNSLILSIAEGSTGTYQVLSYA